MFKDTRGKAFYDIIKAESENGQVNISYNYPGTIRAFHMHKEQTDLFFCIEGEFKLVLTNPQEIIYMSPGDTQEIKPNRWHGFQVLGNKRGIMLEYTTRKYNPKDDFKEVWNTFDSWEMEKK